MTDPAPAAVHGLDPEFNHDLNPGEDFLAAFPPLRHALYDDRLFTTFTVYDAESKRNKKLFHNLGFASLMLALLPLAVAALFVIFGSPVIPAAAVVTLVIQLCGVVSVGLIVLLRLRRNRVRWCQAMFLRERLRQWHFQLFLDGRLVGVLPDDAAAFDAELKKRWDVLMYEMRDGRGMMMEFVRKASRKRDFFHEPTPYDNAPTLTAVCEALWKLRLRHQAAYTTLKLEPQGETVFALADRNVSSERFAIATLGLAVLVVALSFVVSLWHMIPSAPHLPFQAEATSRVLDGCALLLAVLSAAARAYRSGFTLPDEVESYEEYRDRVRELEASFDGAREDDKIRLFEKLEEEAAAELRRFLRMKLRATFVF